MVSFSCNYCQDVVTKPKVLNHVRSCGGDHYTCVDCMATFDLNTIKGHTSCVSETQKYQGKWKPPPRPAAGAKRNRDSSDSDSDGPKVAAKSAPTAVNTKAAASPAQVTAVAPAPVAASTATPHAADSAHVTVPSIDLGSLAQVSDMCRSLLEADASSHATFTHVATQFVKDIYTKRIVKAVAQALRSQLPSGETVFHGLRCDEHHVSLAAAV